MEKNSKQISLQAEGISCTGCAMDLETVLRNIDGILNATVSYAEEIINIKYNPDEIAAEHILALIKKIGFKTKPII